MVFHNILIPEAIRNHVENAVIQSPNRRRSALRLIPRYLNTIMVAVWFMCPMNCSP